VEVMGTIRRTRESFLRQETESPDSRPQTAHSPDGSMVMLALLGNEQSANTRMTRRRSDPLTSAVSLPQEGKERHEKRA
jgi:hypothetical protein